MLDTLSLFIPIAIMFAILPGPDFALILKISLRQSRLAARGAACGIGVGVLLHTVAAVIGLSALIAKTPLLFNLLKYAGALYLFWMGVHIFYAQRKENQRTKERMAASKAQNNTARFVSPPITTYDDSSPTHNHAVSLAPSQAPSATPRNTPHHQVNDSLPRGSSPLAQWRNGFTQGAIVNMLNPKAIIFMLTFLPQFVKTEYPASLQLAALGLCMALIAGGWFFLLASSMDYARRFLQNPRFTLWLERSTALLLMSFGIKLLITKLH